MPTSAIDTLLASSTAPSGAAGNSNTAPGQLRTFDDALARAGESTTNPRASASDASTRRDPKTGEDNTVAPTETSQPNTATENAVSNQVSAVAENSEEAEREEAVTDKVAEVIAVTTGTLAVQAEENIEIENGDAELSDGVEGSEVISAAAEEDGDTFETPRKQPVAVRSEKTIVADGKTATAVQPDVNVGKPDDGISASESDAVVAEPSGEEIVEQEVAAGLDTNAESAAKHSNNDNGGGKFPETPAAAIATAEPVAAQSASATAPAASLAQPIAASKVPTKLETSTAPPRRRSSNQSVAETPANQHILAASAAVETPTSDNSYRSIESVAPAIDASIAPPTVEGETASFKASDSTNIPEKVPHSRDLAVNSTARWSNLWHDKSSSATESKPRGTLPHFDAARFVQRVAKAFRAADEAGGPIRLRLSPPELGSLKVEVVLRDGSMFARLEAETTTARSLLVDNLPALRERLAEQNIKIERFDVELKQDNQPGDNAANTAFAFDQQRDAQARHANARGKPHTATVTGNITTTAQPTSRTDNGRLNVLI